MAQTVRYWRAPGTQPGDLNTAGNYHDGVYGASAVPLASNIVYFNEDSGTISGSPATLNLALAHVGVTRGHTGTGGGTGTSLTIAVNTNGTGQYANHVFEYAAGGGRWYVTAGTNGIGIVRVDTLGKLFLTGGTINTRLEVVAGEVDVNDSVDLSGKIMDVYGGAVNVEYKADGTDPTVNVYGGVTILRRPAGTMTVNGGRVIVRVEKETGGAATLTVNNGEVDWQAGNVTSALNLNSGRMTFRNAIKPIDLSGATVTAADTDIDIMTAPGSKITWPASTSIVLKAGKAAQLIARVASATI